MEIETAVRNSFGFSSLWTAKDFAEHMLYHVPVLSCGNGKYLVPKNGACADALERAGYVRA